MIDPNHSGHCRIHTLVQRLNAYESVSDAKAAIAQYIDWLA